MSKKDEIKGLRKALKLVRKAQVSAKSRAMKGLNPSFMPKTDEEWHIFGEESLRLEIEISILNKIDKLKGK